MKTVLPEVLVAYKYEPVPRPALGNLARMYCLEPTKRTIGSALTLPLAAKIALMFALRNYIELTSKCRRLLTFPLAAQLAPNKETPPVSSGYPVEEPQAYELTLIGWVVFPLDWTFN